MSLTDDQKLKIFGMSGKDLFSEVNRNQELSPSAKKEIFEFWLDQHGEPIEQKWWSK